MLPDVPHKKLGGPQNTMLYKENRIQKSMVKTFGKTYVKIRQVDSISVKLTLGGKGAGTHWKKW